MKATLTIELLSDTCPAAGRGRDSEVDIEIEFDDLGLPVIGGKRIKALLHEAWREMTSHFPPDNDVGIELFGLEGSLAKTSILSIDDAMLDRQTRDWIAWAVNRDDDPIDPKDILHTLTGVRAQSSEERKTGAPSEGTLRRMRVLRRGLSLQASVTWAKTPSTEHERCLARALAGVRHLGSSRNRGLGHVRLTINSVNEEPNPQTPDIQANPLNEGNWLFIPIAFQLDAPAIFSTLGGDPNSAMTYPYIPGSALRGALAQVWLQNNAFDNETFPNLFLNDNVRFLNAYPTIDETRSAPVPCSWRKAKNVPVPGEDQFKVCDATVAGANNLKDFVRISEQFFSIESSTKKVFNTALQASVHNQRDPEKGKAWKDNHEKTHGAVFTYEAIRGGQCFMGMLQVKEPEAGSSLAALLGSATLRLGRSRSAKYGASAKTTVREPREQEWALLPSSRVPATIPKDSEFLLLLTSPYLGRNPATGQADPGWLLSELRERFQNADCTNAVLEVETIGGFNRKWGLELPQFPAVAAGSTLLLKAKADISDWQATENDGLGERRNEGFGRFVLLPAGTQEPFTVKLLPPARVEMPTSPPTERLKGMQQELLLQKARPRLQVRAEEMTRSAKNIPPNSLLGRLRTAVRQNEPNVLRELLDLLKKEGAKKLDRCRIRTVDNVYTGESLRRVFDDLLPANTDADINPLIHSLGLQDLCSVSRLLDNPKDQLPAIANLLRREFLEALLSALQKKNRQEETS